MEFDQSTSEVIYVTWEKKKSGARFRDPGSQSGTEIPKSWKIMDFQTLEACKKKSAWYFFFKLTKSP